MMEQPVPSDREQETRLAYARWLHNLTDEHAVDGADRRSFAAGYAAAMADLQELREAAEEVLDDLPAEWEEFDEEMQSTWDTAPSRAFYGHVQALRAALARLEGR
jgi:hypothetical protein